MDTNKILSNVLKQQGIKDFRPIKNRENCYGYFKDGRFFICDENLKIVPFEEKGIIVFCDNGTEVVDYELGVGMGKNGHDFMVINNQGTILVRGRDGVHQREDGIIVLGQRKKISCDIVDLIRLDRVWERRFEYSSAASIKSNIIKDGQICEHRYLIGETPYFDILVDYCNANDDNPNGIECVVYSKKGEQIARKNCVFVWKHEDETLSLVSNACGNKCNFLEIDKCGSVFEYSEQVPHEDIEFRIADRDCCDSGLTEYISDNYLVLEYYDDRCKHAIVLKREDGIHSLKFTDNIDVRDGHYWFDGVKNNILTIGETIGEDVFYSFYDLPSMEIIGGSGKSDKYAVIEKSFGGTLLHGVMNVQDNRIIIPLRFDDITIIEDSLFIVEIDKNKGIYSEKSLIIPIGQLTDYEKVFRNVIEYSCVWDKKGLLFIIESDYGEVEIRRVPAEYDWLSYRECKDEFDYQNEKECGWIELHKDNKFEKDKRFGLAFKENVIEAGAVFDGIEYVGDYAAYVYREGKKGYCNCSGLLIKPQYDGLERMGYGLFFADGDIKRYDKEEGETITLEKLGHEWDLLQMSLGYYAFKRNNTNEYLFWNYDKWSLAGVFCTYSDNNGFIRLNDGIVYLYDGNRFICKQIDGFVSGPPEELETIEEIIEWEKNTLDDDEVDARETERERIRNLEESARAEQERRDNEEAAYYALGGRGDYSGVAGEIDDLLDSLGY